MSLNKRTVTLMATVSLLTPIAGAQWVTFVNETSTRMPTGSGLNTPATSTTDPDEKDYAWADLDQDGDIDLVCVRKEPFTSSGRRINVLFMNEGIAEGHSIDGVLVDRTSLYATATDVGGDLGFNTPTNDRDVVIGDVNNDGWLDVITATTLSEGQPKHINHPRVYINLGEQDGQWLGLKFENFRIPQMHATAVPRFCSVAVGDVTGDGAVDLYFGDYDSGPAESWDYNNRLLVNNGTGSFADESTARLTTEMITSAFGAASVIADVNNDGVKDVIKQTSLNAPQHIAVTYNNPTSEGIFNLYDIVNQQAPYFVSAGDLNNDGRLDLIVTDDATDTYLINTGNDAQNRADFTTLSFPSSPSAGFGSQSIAADLNNDGFKDVLIADVDVDIPGCSRRMHIYRNLGNIPNVSFQEQGSVIPDSSLTGTHNVAVFDINNDGWQDLVVGRCTGTAVWMNTPPAGLVFTYPSGVPTQLVPDQPTTIQVQVAAYGGGSPAAGTGRLNYALNGSGTYTVVNMVHLGGNLYEGTIPALPCTDFVRFYFSANLSGGGTFKDPSDAPVSYYESVATTGLDVTLRDEIEGSIVDWTITSGGAFTAGQWQQAQPNGTLDGGNMAAPNEDATAGSENILCFVTENGPAGGTAGANDLDGGPVYLISPTFDLAGKDASISFSRWFYCNDAGTSEADFLDVAVSNDGGANWTTLASLRTGSTGSAWESASFIVSQFIAPTANMRVRFSASDSPNNSVTEAGIDNFQIEEILCGVECPGDIDESGDVGFGDVLAILGAWGPCAGCPSDLDGDDQVGFNDLLQALSLWGDCP